MKDLSNSETLETGTDALSPRSIKVIDPKLKAIDDLFDAWLNQHIYNSVVSRDTPIVNHVRASVDKLRESVKALV